MNLHHLDPNDLVRQSTIARRLNVTNQAVANWLTRNPTYHRGSNTPPTPFPPPALPPIDGVEFWHWPTVLDWATKSGKASPPVDPCPYPGFSHTREWCGRPQCRES